MSDPLPMFDDPIPPAEDPKPRKPRQKPVKRRKVKKAAVAKSVKKRRKRRTIKPTVEKHAGGQYSKETYRTIAHLIAMKSDVRDFVFDVVKELTNGRAD
jgi:hypothetical protein